AGGRLARLEELLLGHGELLVGCALLGLDAPDRLPRLLLTKLLGPELLVGAPPLEGDLILLARYTGRGFAGRRHLQIVADDRLFLAVQLRLEGDDRRFRARD